MIWDDMEHFINNPDEARKFIRHKIMLYDVLKIRSGTDYQYFFVYDIRQDILYGYEAYQDPISNRWRARMPEVLIITPTKLVGKNLQIIHNNK